MKKVTTVFLDLDGVLVDWLNGMRKFAGLPDSVYDGFRKDPSTLSHEAVEPIFGGKLPMHTMMRERPMEFWRDLDLFPWANRLVKELKQEFPLAFLTKPGKNPSAASGKLKWQLDLYPDIPILIGGDKFLAASPTKALVDDDQYQLDRFALHGGLAIRWPNQFELERLTKNAEIENIIAMIIFKIQHYQEFDCTYVKPNHIPTLRPQAEP